MTSNSAHKCDIIAGKYNLKDLSNIKFGHLAVNLKVKIMSNFFLHVNLTFVFEIRNIFFQE